MISDRIFREYDIRGVVGVDLNPDAACMIGRAFGTFLRGKNSTARRVSVGRDVRISSPELADGIIAGIRATGLDVIDLGVCPTPLQYFSLFHLDLDGGIMVTGSHNPADYNGFKVSAGKETIHGKDIQRLREIIASGSYVRADREGAISSFPIVDVYQDYMLREFSGAAASAVRKLTVVVDAGNGTAGLVAPRLIEAMGCNVIPLYCEPDGRFPNHHPDPTVVENIRDLIRITMEQSADIGIGYDGDADRIGVVNRRGEVVWGDQLMIVLSRELLRARPGATVIGDVKCSQLLFDDVAAHGGKPIMWKTGHSLVKQKMRDEQAPLAGEFSGHIFIGDRYFGFDDAIYTSLRVIEIMQRTGSDIAGLLADVPAVHSTPEIRIDCPDDRKKAAVECVVQRFIEYHEHGGAPFAVKGVDTTDGVRVLFDDGWGLVRMSNTQPVVVMRVEARSDASVAKYRAFLEQEFSTALSSV